MPGKVRSRDVFEVPCVVSCCFAFLAGSSMGFQRLLGSERAVWLHRTVITVLVQCTPQCTPPPKPKTLNPKFSFLVGFHKAEEVPVEVVVERTSQGSL